MRHNVVLRTIPASLTVLAMSLPLLAQLTTASLEGIVRDQTGAVIAGAHVQVTNTATNVVTAATTDSSGRFLAPSLPPGPYQVMCNRLVFRSRSGRGAISTSTKR